MSIIHVLNNETINKIAAGEVVERPANVVKELVENSIDSGANAITVEIKDGGISFIRVTDNGSGIDKEDVREAFLRHATSKINDASDLNIIGTLGFRGEALSSIAAVSQVELLTKTNDDIIGTQYIIEGGKEIGIKDIGIPGGTTIIVRNIFFNTPARRKFLKSAITEGGYIADILEHLALANPDISFKFIMGSQIKFHTSGNGNVKELIYRLFGKECADAVVPIESSSGCYELTGFLGKPELNRSTRNYENYFINGRYVKSDVISKALEEGYKEYLMQHRFPFCVLYITTDPGQTDVNVHPTKMEVRFQDSVGMSDFISSAVSSALKVREMIPDSVLNKPESPKPVVNNKAPEPFEQNRIKENVSVAIDEKLINESGIDIRRVLGENVPGKTPYPEEPEIQKESNVIKASDAVIVNSAVQMEMFDDRLLSYDAVSDYEIVGQIFGTYWLFTYKDKLILMDQHAAHEKIKYEALVKRLNDKTTASQMISPAMVITLSPTELSVLNDYSENFKALGYEIEEFGGQDISLRAVPTDLYGRDPKELFLDVLDELAEGRISGVPEVINQKLASMACKSAVKGNTPISEAEVKALLADLLTLDNPYNCPHGRPTMITMTRSELDKRFKRIV
ncbi:MAG: DNA mismatch repair endonuclease MutL [Lachnospiraceae bacterium]|nr:DNA mismatch repair endonuclease MutL [Lachnospiraceae bacterium]